MYIYAYTYDDKPTHRLRGNFMRKHPEKETITPVDENDILSTDVLESSAPKKKKKERKRRRDGRRRFRLGDRNDGYKVRTLQPMNRLMAYIMPTRNDACNTFADSIDIGLAEAFCRQKVKEGHMNFGMLHIFLAAYVRAISQRPALNRFISGQKVFHRHDIEISMVVKKKMSAESPDTCIKVYFEPTDTVDDVYRKFNEVVMANKGKEDDESSFDVLAKVLNFIPGLLLRWTVKLLNFLDYFGLLPRFLTKLSPFHGTMIITSMGSLGIKPIYHHLYNFGNLPVFLSYGTKRTEYQVDKNGNVIRRRFIDIKAVTDERICDGFYYASAFKLFKKYVENPSVLETPVAKVYEDID